MDLYAFTAKEMRRLGAQDGEISIYSVFGGNRSNSVFRQTGDFHNSNLQSGGDYAFRFDASKPKDTEDLCITSGTDDGLETLTVHLRNVDGREKEAPYRFEREERNNLLVQTGGPARPFTIANFGTQPLRVDTISGGRFTVPCGMIRRLEGVGSRPKKKVLLTFEREDCKAHVTAEMLCLDGSWRKLDVITGNCHDLLEVKDDGAIVAQIRSRFGGAALLDRLEKEPDYELYVRKSNCSIKRYDMRLVDGVPGYGEVRIEGLEDGTVYDFGKLRRGMAPEQCVTVLPNVRPMPTPEHDAN